MHGAKNSDERLPGVPSIYELMDKYKTAESGRRLATALMAAGEFHRPYLAPPNMRPEHVKILREAFLKTAKDPAFVEETKKKKLDLDPSSLRLPADSARPQHVLGNRTRLIPVTEIRLDERWRTALSDEQLRRIGRVTRATEGRIAAAGLSGRPDRS